ncbi:MAG TPA: (2Fe-2S)-binding protein [candidate division Zixibacteria bacterium]|nr:(2Fe-2S)-binding protein [candidate division Zixibacteria bacterium]
MVNRCVCFDKTFRELREIAARMGAKSVEQLQSHVEFGKNCGLCLPYVRLMLQTGKTSFEVIPPPES